MSLINGGEKNGGRRRNGSATTIAKDSKIIIFLFIKQIVVIKYS